MKIQICKKVKIEIFGGGRGSGVPPLSTTGGSPFSQILNTIGGICVIH